MRKSANRPIGVLFLFFILGKLLILVCQGWRNFIHIASDYLGKNGEGGTDYFDVKGGIWEALIRLLTIEIIREDGKTPEFEVVSEEKAKELLVEKLQEEMQEFLESREMVELADMLEVMEAYAEMCGVSWDELMEMKREKAEKRGGFRERLVLKCVEE